MPASKKGKLFREEQPIPKELTDKTIFNFDFFSFSHLGHLKFNRHFLKSIFDLHTEPTYISKRFFALYSWLAKKNHDIFPAP